MNSMFEAYCTGQVSLAAAVNNIYVFHEAMNGFKIIRFIKGLLWECEYIDIDYQRTLSIKSTSIVPAHTEIGL